MLMLNNVMMSNIISKSNIFSVDTPETWGRGLLLGGNPKNPKDSLYKGVILLFHQIDNSVLGLQLNRRLDGVNLKRIVSNLGFEGVEKIIQDNVYQGGLLGSNRMHFVHSLDWTGSSTITVDNCVGITSDLSILSALCGNQGPRLYRACVGSWRWDMDTLKEQIFNLDPDVDVQDHLWEVSQVNSSLVFNYEGEAQWTRVMESSAQMQSRCWINQSFS